MSENGHKHTVQRGETLSSIAQHHGTTVSALLAANPQIRDPNRIFVGQIIHLPGQSSPTVPPVPVTTGSGQPSLSALNAILEQFQSRGATAATARQDRLPHGGVDASEKMAETDRQCVMRHKEKLAAAAQQFALPPALLAAIASRESRGGNVLSPDGTGDNGHGFGVMQVDDRNPFPVVQDGGPFGQPHINQATDILSKKLKTVKNQHAELSEVEQLQMAVSRYNGGRGLTPPDSDQGTTGGDYMNDVWARARYYARVEQWG